MRMDGRYHAAVPEAGQVIGGKYRLRRPVGEGAMASIWSAVHETLGRPVAVKFIHSRAMSEVAAARFMREAKIAASVQHRFVVDIMVSLTQARRSDVNSSRESAIQRYAYI